MGRFAELRGQKADFRHSGSEAQMQSETVVYSWGQASVRITVAANDGAANITEQVKGERHLRMFSGLGHTDSRGFWQLTLPAHDSADTSAAYLSIIATPRDRKAAPQLPRATYLVTRAESNSVEVWSFTADGVAAPSVEFSWQCVIADP